jgi:uncharacterized protein (TIGR02284 family)
MNKSTDLLNELIEIARDGKKFYLDAATKVTGAEVQQVFRTQASAREQLINDLSQHVVIRGEVASRDETLVGITRKLYAEILATLSSDRDGVYINQLEEVEDRLLDHYRKALEQAESEDVRRVLVSHMPTVQAAHDRMRALKRKKHAA